MGDRGHPFPLSPPAKTQFTDRGSVQVLIDKNTGALQALTEDDGVSLSGAELAAVESSARDAQGGWYRIRALRGDEAGAMTSVPMVRGAAWPDWHGVNLAHGPIIPPHNCSFFPGKQQCDVVRAGFRENLTLTLDGYTGHLIR